MLMIMVLLLWLGSGGFVSASSIVLNWTAPTTLTDGMPLTDLAGHRLYQGTRPGVYDTMLPIPTGATAALSGLLPGTYYWAVTAVRANGIESAYSVEATATVTDDTTPPTVQLTEPVAGATVPRNADVTIRASAQDNQGVALVRVYVDNEVQCTVPLAQATCVWHTHPANKRQYALRAEAVDTAGLVGHSLIVMVISG